MSNIQMVKQLLIKKHCILIVFLVGLVFAINAQDKEWINTLSKDGTTKVNYCVYYIEDEAGKQQQILEYESEIKANATLEQCINAIRSVELHTQFLTDAKESKLIEQVSENEWTVYYYFNAIWPLPDYDSATKVVQEIISDNEVKITSVAEVDSYKDNGVGRLQINDAVYTFSKIDETTTNIKLWVRVQPTIQAPKWLIKTQFPKLPAGIMKKLAELAGKI